MGNVILESDLEQIYAVLKPKAERFRGGVVVVTGCAGFLGYYVMNFLVRYGAMVGLKKVIGLDTFKLDKSTWLADLQKDFPSLLILKSFDISTDKLDSIPEAAEARFVIHMASIASPMFYRQYPLETIDANIWGLRHLLDTYRDRKTLEGLLFFSSSEIYGDPDPAHVPTSEDYRGSVSCSGPRACYDESKRFGETLCYVFANKYGVPITVARPFNNYGPGMRLEDKRLPADLARYVMRDEDIVLYSNGSPTRTFCYISDAIAGYFLCLLHGTFEAFNIGLEKPEISVADLAEIYRDNGSRIRGYTGRVVYKVSEDADYLSHNPQRRCPDLTKARTVLGYKPSVDIHEGVRRYLQFLTDAKA